MRHRLLSLVALFCVLLPAALARAEDKPDSNKPVHKTVGVDEFENLSKEPNAVILDVRTPAEYETGHLKDAVLLDINSKDFDQRIKALDKDKTYLVHCAVGMRGEKACKRMDGFDFPKVYNLEGGIKAWKKAGKPVEK